MSIANQSGISNALAASMIVNDQLNGRNYTWLWTTAALDKPYKFRLQDYATGNGPIWNVGANTPIASLTGYDEVFVYIVDPSGGAGYLARFGWSAENLSGAPGPGADAISDDLMNEWGYPSQAASAVIVGGLDAQGNGSSILRLAGLPVEYGPLSGSKVFRLQVKGPMLFVGLSYSGAPGANHNILVQVVPRSLGVPRSGG